MPLSRTSSAWLYLGELLEKGVSENPAPNISDYCLDYWLLSLSTIWWYGPIAEDSTYVIEYGEVELLPNWKIHPYWLAFHGAGSYLFHTTGREK